MQEQYFSGWNNVMVPRLRNISTGLSCQGLKFSSQHAGAQKLLGRQVERGMLEGSEAPAYVIYFSQLLHNII